MTPGLVLWDLLVAAKGRCLIYKRIMIMEATIALVSIIVNEGSTESSYANKIQILVRKIHS